MESPEAHAGNTRRYKAVTALRMDSLFAPQEAFWEVFAVVDKGMSRGGGGCGNRWVQILKSPLG